MKKAIIIILILVALILLFPIRGQFKDGGSVEYRAILYTVYDVHSLYDDGSRTEVRFVEGTIVEILGHQVYNNTTPHIENFGDNPDLEKNSDVNKETKIVIDRDTVTKIEIIRYHLSTEGTRSVTVTEETSINYIIDNLTSLTLKEREHGGQSNEPVGLEYELYFYNTAGEVFRVISISIDGLIDFHSVVGGELDEAYIDGLFD